MSSSDILGLTYRVPATQSKALRLADTLDHVPSTVGHEAAAELRRLDAENKRLLRARNLYEAALLAGYPKGASGDVFELWNSARAALGEQQ
jgi:hypothetical protein